MLSKHAPPPTHAARVQIKVNTKGDAAAEERWGAGKQEVDAMDHKLWLLDHLVDQRRAAQKTAQQEVRPAPCVRACSGCAARRHGFAPARSLVTMQA